MLIVIVLQGFHPYSALKKCSILLVFVELHYFVMPVLSAVHEHMHNPTTEFGTQCGASHRATEPVIDVEKLRGG